MTDLASGRNVEMGEALDPLETPTQTQCMSHPLVSGRAPQTRVQPAKSREENRVGFGSSEVRKSDCDLGYLIPILHEPWSVCQGTSSAFGKSFVWLVKRLAHDKFVPRNSVSVNCDGCCFWGRRLRPQVVCLTSGRRSRAKPE